MRLFAASAIIILQFSIFNFQSRLRSFLLGSFLFAYFAVPLSDAIEPAPIPSFRPDRILIQPKAARSPNLLAEFHLQHRVTVLRTEPGLQILTVPPNETVSTLVAAYQQSGLVDFAEPDYLGHTAATIPNDPKYLDGTLWGLAKISAPDGWDVQTSASNIIVAVLDTGVRYTRGPRRKYLD